MLFTVWSNSSHFRTKAGKSVLGNLHFRGRNSKNINEERSRVIESVVANFHEFLFLTFSQKERKAQEHLLAIAFDSIILKYFETESMFRTTRPASSLFLSQQEASADHHDASSSSSSASSILNCRQQAKLMHHHPGVKLPPRLEDKPKTEQIERSCDRFKSYPKAVDTLYKTLMMISQFPNERKYRVVDKSKPGYQRSLAHVHGIEQLLRSINFSSRNSHSPLLVLDNLDLDLIQIALTSLENTKQTKEYNQAKTELEFAKEMYHQLHIVHPAQSELMERKSLLAKCPKEPSKGRGAVIKIMIPTSAGVDSTTATTTMERRFDGDDTLEDVLNWFGGQLGTTFKENLQNRKWSLVDINRRSSTTSMIDCSNEVKNQQQTLQYLGFWPSARLALRPSTVEWTKGDRQGASSSSTTTAMQHISPYGLGSTSE